MLTDMFKNDVSRFNKALDQAKAGKSSLELRDFEVDFWYSAFKGASMRLSGPK